MNYKEVVEFVKNKKIGIVIFLLLVIQIIIPTILVSAISPEKNENESFFSKISDDKPIENIELGKESEVTYHMKSEGGMKSKIIFPKGMEVDFSQFDEEVKSQLIVVNENEIIIEWDKKPDKATDQKIVLPPIKDASYLTAIDLDNEDNSLNEITLGVIPDTEVEKKLLAETIESEDNNKQNDQLTSFFKKSPINIGPKTAKNSWVQASAPTPYNVALSLNSASPTIDAGAKAVFKLELKVTGALKNYNNVQLIVNLPKDTKMNQNLQELQIADVTPYYDSGNHRLVYAIPLMKTGQTYRTFVELDTVNGSLLNGTKLQANASIEANDFSRVTDTAEMTVNSSFEVSIDKTYDQTLGKDNTKPPISGDYGIWKITATIPKKKQGQLFIKPGTIISITEKIPEYLEFMDYTTTMGYQYNSSNKTVTWNIVAPSIESQTAMSDYLFQREFQVRTRFSANIPNYTKIINQATISAVGLDGVTVNSSASANVVTATGKDSVPTTPGSLFSPAHFGPTDGEGTISNTYTYNMKMPTVYESARLGFSWTMHYGMENGLAGITQNGRPLPDIATAKILQKKLATGNNREFSTTYMIDNKLTLQSLTIPLPQIGAYNNRIAALDQLPQSILTLIVNGQRVDRQVNWSNLSNQIIDGKLVYTRELLGLLPTDDVSQIEFKMINPPPETALNRFLVEFSIKPNSTGDVINKVSQKVIDASFNTYLYNVTDENKYLGPRQAKVVPPPSTSYPLAQTDVAFVTSDGNIVKEGPNKVKVSFKNDAGSLMYLNGPFKSYVLLPEGVVLTQNSGRFANGTYRKTSDNFQNSKRHLVELSWDNNITSLNRDENLTAEVDVNITKDALDVLDIGVYSYAEKSTTLKVGSNNDSPIIKNKVEYNYEFMNPNLGQYHYRVHTDNQYQILRKNSVKTEKLVKGEKDNNYSLMGHTIPGGIIDYQLRLTNSGQDKIRKLTMLDVLPSVGDLGVTDNLPRNSQFTPTLTGPIAIPNDWNGKVTVLYSSTANPKRDDLMANVKYPDNVVKMTNPTNSVEPNWLTASQIGNWSEIRSFKVALNKDVTLNPGENITLSFRMKAPEAKEITNPKLLNTAINENERAAWNSFALALNDLQVVEPLRVGVVMEPKDKPVLSKKVNGQDKITLTNKEDIFSWEIKPTFSQDASSWESVTITDKLEPILDIQENGIKVYDSQWRDIKNQGSLIVNKSNNTVQFSLNKINGSYAYLAGETYTIIIPTKIKADTAPTVIETYIKNSGIPNQATLTFNQSNVVSNIPRVIPPKPIVRRGILPATGGFGNPGIKWTAITLVGLAGLSGCGYLVWQRKGLRKK